MFQNNKDDPNKRNTFQQQFQQYTTPQHTNSLLNGGSGSGHHATRPGNYFQSSSTSSEDSAPDSTTSSQENLVGSTATTSAMKERTIIKTQNSNINYLTQNSNGNASQISHASSEPRVHYMKPMSLSEMCQAKDVGVNNDGSHLSSPLAALRRSNNSDEPCYKIRLDSKSNLQFINDFRLS